MPRHSTRVSDVPVVFLEEIAVVEKQPDVTRTKEVVMFLAITGETMR